MKLALLSLGKRGASLHLAREMMAAAVSEPEIKPHLILSAQNDTPEQFASFAPHVTLVPTFETGRSWQAVVRYPVGRAAVFDALQRERPDAVLSIMPHLWSPLLTPAIRRQGIRYGTIIHDASPHPGDPTALLTPWLLRDADRADLVVTLSREVAERLKKRGVSERRILSLFHPDVAAVARARVPRMPGAPFRLLFVGRIQAYKGVPDLLAALPLVGSPVTLTLAGAGDISMFADAIVATGTTLINRWLSDEDFAELLQTHDAIVLPYREASQSGVAAMAFANTIPVVALPIGGITEQVIDGETGVLATGRSPAALAAAITRLATDVALFETIRARLAATADRRSMARFLDAVVTRLDI